MSAKVLLVAGARPNYMKIAPIWWAMRERGDERFTPVLVHTGQHYDDSMSDDFFRDLGLPEPRRQPGRGLGIARRADRPSDGRLRGGAPGGATRRRGRRRRRQLDGGLRAGDVEDRPREQRPAGATRAGARRGGAAQSRPRHARGGQPRRHRRALRPALHHLPRGGRQPGARGPAARAHPLRRQPDDRLAATLPRGAERCAIPRAARARRARRSGSARCTARRTSTIPTCSTRLLDALAEIAADVPVLLPAAPADARAHRALRAGRAGGIAGTARARHARGAASSASSRCRTSRCCRRCGSAPSCSPTRAASRRRPRRSACRA